MKTKAYAVNSATTPLEPFSLERRATGGHDVQSEILFCGVCHSDVHTVRNEWQGTTYPCVPGHEIIGRVTINAYLVLLKRDGNLTQVGVASEPLAVDVTNLIFGRRKLRSR
jgi:uncharacterized zinc-type alcohol dehydrogenase-like protein